MKISQGLMGGSGKFYRVTTKILKSPPLPSPPALSPGDK